MIVHFKGLQENVLAGGTMHWARREVAAWVDSQENHVTMPEVAGEERHQFHSFFDGKIN